MKSSLEDKVISELHNFSLAADVRPQARNSKDNKSTKQSISKNNTRSSIVVIMFLFIFACIGLGLWQFIILKTELKKANTALTVTQNAINQITGDLSKTGNNLNEKNSVTIHKFSNLDSEIRKLWDIANKRNKNDIKENTELLQKTMQQVATTVKNMQTALLSIKTLERNANNLSATQAATIKEIEASINQLGKQLQNIQAQQDDSTKKTATLTEKINQASDDRVQLNKQIIQLTSTIRSLKYPKNKGL